MKRLALFLHAKTEELFPEKRVFLRSDTDTKFIRLKSGTQALGWLGGTALIVWSIVAAAIILMDSIGAGNFREQARREQSIYQERLNALSSERDLRQTEALAAQERFNSALAQVSIMQSELLSSEDRRRELETGIDVIQSTLRKVMSERDRAREEVTVLTATIDGENTGDEKALPEDAAGTLAFMTAALEQTAVQRDGLISGAEDAIEEAQKLAGEIEVMQERNDEIFRQLEEAMTVSVEPLDKMFQAAGLDTDNLLRQVRRGYSGQGGPLTPLSFSTRGGEPDKDGERANGILNEMDRLNLYRIAAEKAPFSVPVKSAYRFTSGFGPRWGRMHNGTDFAAPHGTPIYTTADGVVIHAGWASGYGRLVKIQHEFGIETRYAHLAKIRVRVGQRVSRGDRIGDMGNSGRSTGTHLHYEVRVGGKPVNPMIYLKAAKNVF